MPFEIGHTTGFVCFWKGHKYDVRTYVWFIFLTGVSVRNGKHSKAVFYEFQWSQPHPLDVTCGFACVEAKFNLEGKYCGYHQSAREGYVWGPTFKFAAEKMHFRLCRRAAREVKLGTSPWSIRVPLKISCFWVNRGRYVHMKKDRNLDVDRATWILLRWNFRWDIFRYFCWSPEDLSADHGAKQVRRETWNKEDKDMI